MNTFALTAFAALACASAPAMAQDITTSVEVPLIDLDLATAEGQAALEARIGAAARTVCGEPLSRDLSSMAAWHDCRTKARAEAMAKIAFASPFDGIELASRL